MSNNPELGVEPSVDLPGEAPTGNLYQDLEIFIQQLGRSYQGRYKLWEETAQSIMNILHSIRKYNEDQTEYTLSIIAHLSATLKEGFQNFAMKRAEIEKYSDIDTEQLNKQFQKTLTLLNLQIRELKLQIDLNKIYHIYAN